MLFKIFRSETKGRVAIWSDFDVREIAFRGLGDCGKPHAYQR